MTNLWLLCDFVISVHKPSIRTSPVVFVKWKCCAWIWGSGGQVSCCARSTTTTLDLQNFFLTQGRDGSFQLHPCSLLSSPVSYNSTLHKGCTVTLLFGLSKTFTCVHHNDTFLQTVIPQAKTFSNYPFYHNLYKGSSLETMVVKYPVMLLMNLKWGKIVEYAWCYCNQMVVA